MFYLHKHIVNFLTNSLSTPNRLLKAVLDDASCKLYVARCKALGLIDKHITGQLLANTRVIHILDLPHYYKLLLFVQQCKDMSGFMTGECVPFSDKPITKDAVWLVLVALSPEYDQLVHHLNYLAGSLKSRNLQ